MIINRYLIRQVLRNQIALLLILFLIFSCQKLIRVLSTVVTGELPAHLVWAIVGFGLPYMLQLILPLSLFLSLLLTYGRLYASSEITAMRACGFSQLGLLKAALWLALLTTIPAAANLLWFGPRANQYEQQVVREMQTNVGLAMMAKGQFRRIANNALVLFIHQVEGQQFKHLFVAQGSPQRDQQFSILVADSGHLQQQLDGTRLLFLDKGVRYSGLEPPQKLQVVQFDHYQARFGQPKHLVLEKPLEGRSFKWLWQAKQPRATLELHWRLTTFVCIPLMALLVVPLSVLNPRQRLGAGILPALLLYLIYFLLQSLIRSAIERGQLVSVAWFWIVSSGYLLLALFLNFRNHWQRPRLWLQSKQYARR